MFVVMTLCIVLGIYVFLPKQYRIAQMQREPKSSLLISDIVIKSSADKCLFLSGVESPTAYMFCFY